MNAGELKESRLGMFKELIMLCEKNKWLKRKNIGVIFYLN